MVTCEFKHLNCSPLLYWMFIVLKNFATPGPSCLSDASRLYTEHLRDDISSNLGSHYSFPLYFQLHKLIKVPVFTSTQRHGINKSVTFLTFPNSKTEVNACMKTKRLFVTFQQSSKTCWNPVQVKKNIYSQQHFPIKLIVSMCKKSLFIKISLQA